MAIARPLGRPPLQAGEASGADRPRDAYVPVLGVWAACSTVAATLVLRFGRSTPFSEDWQFLPYVAGRRPVSLAWLWEQHNEHRIPLVKALQVVLLRAFDFDYRATTMANVVALALLALGLVHAARRVRGTYRLSDAAIPLLVLSPHLPALQWGIQAQFTATAVGLGLILMVAAYGQEVTALRGRAVAVWSVALLTLAVSGLNGVITLPLLAGALAVAAWRTKGGSGAARAAAMGVAIVGLAVVPAYFVGLHSTPHDWGRPGPADLITVAVRLAASPLGPGVDWLWALVGSLVVILGALTVAASIRRRLRPPLLLVAVAGAELVLAAAVAFGRGGQPWNVGLSNHYATLFVPLIGLFVLAWAPACGRAVRAVGGAGAAALLVIYVGAATTAVRDGQRVRAAEQAFVRDVQAGRTTSELAARFGGGLFYYVDSDVTRGIVAEQLPVLLSATGKRSCPPPVAAAD